MAAIIYCVQADVESILGATFVKRRGDDNEDGALSTTELSYVTDAIDRAATTMNATLEMRYTLSELSGNDWCKWCNAIIAAVFVSERRGNNIPPSTAREYDKYQEDLKGIKSGKMKVPQASDNFGPSPMVSNMLIDMGNHRNQIRVDTSESTGPRGTLKRNTI